jgi:hypothetical protein
VTGVGDGGCLPVQVAGEGAGEVDWMVATDRIGGGGVCSLFFFFCGGSQRRLQMDRLAVER